MSSGTQRPVVRAFAREAARAYEPTEPYEVCISVTGTRSAKADLSPYFTDICRVQFDDLDWYYWSRLEKTGETPAADIKPMSDAQAEYVAAFIQEHADSDAIICHCEAGVSRSVGIARAVEEIVHDATPRESFEKHYVGNEYVRRKVLRAAGREVDDPKSEPLSTRFRSEDG